MKDQEREARCTWEKSMEITNIKTTLYINTKKEVEKNIFFGMGKKKQLANILLEKEIENKVEIRHNIIGMRFALIPTGDFLMGSPEDENGRMYDEGPMHKVSIIKQFCLGIYPVTQQEWKAIMENNPSNFKGDDLPVENVSWDDVQDFVRKLNKKEGTNKYRLPSETEWEYSARAGTTTSYFFGEDALKLDKYSWYKRNSGRKTHPVGQKQPNIWGLSDMHGNILEWVQDSVYSVEGIPQGYDVALVDGSAWESENSLDRVIRGGCFLNGALECRSASRSRYGKGDHGRFLGFRLLREV